MKRRFTLIEIIAVIAVLGILAAIIIPNVSNKKERAMITQVNSNIRNIQTAMDMYALDHNNQYASIIQPTLEEPQIVEFEMLYPKYLKSLPKKVLNEYYWVDFMGKVWGSTVDAPTEILQTEVSTEWNTSSEVESYHVYIVEKFDTLSTVRKEKLKMKQAIINHKDINRFVSKTNEKLLISAIDENGLETAPVGMNYKGVPEDWFQPIIKKEGAFTFEITSNELMYWDGFYKREDKPEGTDIIYEFAIKDVEGNYTPFSDDFHSLEPSKAIQIKITMIGHNGKLPSVLDFRLYYHFEYEKQLYKNVERVVSDNKIIDKIVLDANQEIEKITYTDNFLDQKDSNVWYEHSTDGVNFNKITSLDDIPKGSGVIHIVRDNKKEDSYKYSYNKPIVKITETPFVSQDISKNYVPSNPANPKPNDPIVKEKGWETVQELVFVSSAADGQIAHWINAEIIDKQPENTRILYRYATGNGFNWNSYVDDFSKLSDSKMLKVYSILQVKEDFIDKVENPEVISIKINSSKGVIDLDTVKPTGVIKLAKDNNADRDVISTSSKINWSYEAYDPQGKKIVETIWGGDKRETYDTAGTYTVTLKLKNEQNYWSDEIKYTFEVKEEKPVAVIGPTDRNTFYYKDQIIFDYKHSYDPDGDKIVKAEWSGDYKEDGTYPLGEHTVKLRIQDEDGNWSDWKSKTFSVISSIFYNIETEAIDSDPNTYVLVNSNNRKKVYWTGDLSNRAIEITYKNNYYSNNDLARVTFYDSSNKIIPMQADTVNDKVNTLILSTQHAVILKRIINVPEGASYFIIDNNSTLVSYAPWIYEIKHFENDNLPNPVTNITSISEHSNITLNWNNPIDSDFNKAAIYRDGLFVGYSTNGTYRDSPLKMNTEYTYTIQTIDNNLNRGQEYVEHKEKTTVGEIEWISDHPELFDNDMSTYVYANSNARRKISWIGDLSNRAIEITYKNNYHSNNDLARVTFYDSANKIIPMQADTVNDKVNTLILSTQHAVILKRIINVPEGASYFIINNNATAISYAPWIYEIKHFENDDLPNPVTNITSISENSSITLNWNNPIDSDFNKAAIYRDGLFVGYSTNGTYIDSTLKMNTEYTYTIQTIDNNFNRGKEYVVHKTKTTVGEIEWISDHPELFDNNMSTYVYANSNARRKISWKGDLSNRAIEITYRENYGSDSTYGRITFYDNENKIIPMQTNTVNDKINTLVLNTPNGSVIKRIINVPDKASYFIIYSNSTIISYAPWIYEIKYFENDKTPNPVTNITSTSTQNSITLNWVNPTDEDFNKVAIYRNGTFIANSTNGTYTDSSLIANTEYTYTIQTIDNNFNRGKDYVEHKSKTKDNLENIHTKINLSGGTGGKTGEYVYTAPNGVVVTSTAPVFNNSNFYYMSYLFDGNSTVNVNTAHWLTDSIGNQSLTFDFLEQRNIKGIIIFPKARTDAFSNFRIFASNNKTDWTQLTDWYNTSASTPNGSKVEYILDVNYRYYKIELTRNASWGVCLGEVEFFE